MSRRNFLGGGIAFVTALNLRKLVKAEETAPAVAEAPETIEQKRERISLELEGVWSQQLAEISKRRTTLSERYNGVVAALKEKKMETSIPTFNGEWSVIVNRFKIVNNAALTQLDGYYEMQNDQEKTLERWERWDKLLVTPTARDPEFPARYTSIIARRKKLADDHAIAILTDGNGKFLHNYLREKKENPKLTHQAYIKRLATVLETPENLAMYLRYYVRYAYDSPTSNWKAEGTPTSHGEYWQSAPETLERMDNGWLLGDCEDQAALAQAILKEMGIEAMLVLMPYHATCSWIERNINGRYDGYDIGNYGLEKNGVGYGVQDGILLGTRYLPTQRKEFAQGFATPSEAFTSVMKKFPRSPTLGVGSEWLERPGFSLAHIVDAKNAQGIRERANSTSYLARADLLKHVRMPKRSLTADASR